MDKQLALEIVLLALHFGWSEDEILKIPNYRRQTYVQSISDLCGGFIEALRMGATNRVEVEKLHKTEMQGFLKHLLSQNIEGNNSETLGEYLKRNNMD
ncbi:MAG TPA: DUF6760 family protein [Pyrinomonadaceae bacterium]|jgi:hypothetical protein